jgi:hypothetical protein
MSAPATPKPRMIPIFRDDERQCIGFLLRRATGVEAYTADEKSLGMFDTDHGAAAGVLNHKKTGTP